jgi:hypothetical protein
MDDYEAYMKETQQVAALFGVDSRERRSLKWFRDNIASIYGRGEIARDDLILEAAASNIVKDRRPGRMFMFRYSPKHKNTEPYWDAFPLVISLDYQPRSILGLNLHYLPPRYRNVFFAQLLSKVNDRSMDEDARIVATYQYLKNSMRFRYFQPCIKRYLIPRVRSKVVIVPPEYWNIAINLPTEAFVKENRQGVWRDSINKIKEP